MSTGRWIVAALVLVLMHAPLAFASTLQVGPGQTYATPCAAIAAAQTNDTIEIQAGTYNDTCSVSVDGLTIRGVNGQATLDANGLTPASHKGILVTSGDNITIENMAFLNASLSTADGSNGAGIRNQSQHLTVRNCLFRDNQDGILSTPLQAGGELLVESSEFDHNGLGTGCTDGNGCTHNMYISTNTAKFTLQYSWSHNVETAHLVKSRASQTFILYNRIGSEGNTSTSRQIDLPNGGDAYVIGNTLQKDSSAGNDDFIAYGEEGLTDPTQVLHVVNNTFVSALTNAIFIDMASGSQQAVVTNNIFFGPGTPWNQGTVTADNLVGTDPLFVDATNYDYHLSAGSPAIDHGVDPGSVGSFSLTPVEEYVHPLSSVPRLSDGTLDSGAFEFGTPITPTSSSSSSSTSSSTSTTSTSASSMSTTGTTGTSASTTGSTGTSSSSHGSSSAGSTNSTSTGSTGSAGSTSSSGTTHAASNTSGSSSSGTSATKGGCSCGSIGAPEWLALLIAMTMWLGRARSSRLDHV
jgi:uncharacterized protein (TIGR03382 family)